jgi:hypothetical protein
VCDETDHDVVRFMNRDGSAIGTERLNFVSTKQREQRASIPVEVRIV